MKNSTTTLTDATWLTPFQRKAIVIVGALAGGAAALLILKWLEARRLARLATDEQADTNKS